MKPPRFFEPPCDEQSAPTQWALLARLAAHVDSTLDRLIEARRAADSAKYLLTRRPVIPAAPPRSACAHVR